MSEQISAYTEPGCNYPAYYNLSKNAGEKVVLTVRDSGCVHVAQVGIPNDALERMAQDIFRYLGIESWEDEQLRAELHAAKAENKRLKESMQATIREMAAQIGKLLAEVAKDATRYRWLRDMGVDGAEKGKWLVIYEGLNEHSLLPDELDAAIDNAMAAAPQNEKEKV